MATRFAPLILRDDYDAFRRLLNDDLPNTYDEWSETQNQEILQLVKAGITCRNIKINPDEFAAYCRAVGQSPNRYLLNDFVVAESRRQND